MFSFPFTSKPSAWPNDVVLMVKFTRFMLLELSTANAARRDGKVPGTSLVKTVNG
jgi:hypothetical protein